MTEESSRREDSSAEPARSLSKVLRPLPANTVSEICDGLVREPSRRSTLFLRNCRRAGRPEVVVALVERTKQLTPQAPAEARICARLAMKLARWQQAAPVLHDAANHAHVEALLNLGRLLHAQERFKLAGVALLAAVAKAQQIDADPSLLGYALANLASLRLDERRLEETVALAERAADCFRRVADSDAAARARVVVAISYYYQQKPRQALSELLVASKQLDLGGHPSTAFLFLHHRALFLEATGQPELAYQLLAQAEDFYHAHASETVWLRGRWVKGRLLLSLNEPEEAALLLEEARRGFLSRQLPFDAALVSLDLALAYLELKRPSVVAAMAREMAAVFTAKKVPREATAALLLFAQAAADYQADALLVRQLLRQLSPERRDALR